MLQQRTVLALVYEETGLLTAQPVDMELQSVLYRHVVGITSQDESVLLSEVSLVWQGCLALVVDVVDFASATLTRASQISLR